jgi:hypothetical protein
MRLASQQAHLINYTNRPNQPRQPVDRLTSQPVSQPINQQTNHPIVSQWPIQINKTNHAIKTMKLSDQATYWRPAICV